MKFHPILLTISVLALGAVFIPSAIAQRRQKAAEIEFLWPSGATNTVLLDAPSESRQDGVKRRLDECQGRRSSRLEWGLVAAPPRVLELPPTPYLDLTTTGRVAFWRYRPVSKVKRLEGRTPRCDLVVTREFPTKIDNFLGHQRYPLWDLWDKPCSPVEHVLARRCFRILIDPCWHPK
jgi:hypothetical protein